MDKNELIKNKIFVDEKKYCGIYFLIDNDEIVYVGKSTNILNRLVQHKNSKDKIFDSYNYIECEMDELEKKEADYIYEYLPKYNKTFQTVNSNYTYVGDLNFFRTDEGVALCFPNQKIKLFGVIFNGKIYVEKYPYMIHDDNDDIWVYRYDEECYNQLVRADN